MQIYLAVTPEASQEAQTHCRNLAHVAYRIGPGSALLRQSLLLQTKGGLLSVSDRQAPFIDSPEDLRDAVLRECGRRGYSGVLLDFEEAPRRDRTAFVSALAPALSSSRRALFLPEGYAGAAPGAAVLLCTAVSGGSFSQYLQEAVAQAGARAGVRPRLVATSAAWPQKKRAAPPLAPLEVREWCREGPVLLCLGTARGLAPEFLARCDGRLRPLRFLGDNHLSVRSAAAILADRILGDFC